MRLPSGSEELGREAGSSWFSLRRQPWWGRHAAGGGERGRVASRERRGRAESGHEIWSSRAATEWKLGGMARWHTSEGKFVGWAHLPNGAKSLAQAIARKGWGRYPREPWIPFAARKALDGILGPESVVWEVGAGYSTLWLADRVRHVTSIEADREWHARLTAILTAEKKTNVDLHYEWVADRMADFPGVADGTLDLLYVDGGPRGRCLANGFRKVKAGGYVYLDNWDTKAFWGEAADFPARHAGEIAESRSFIDYVPAQFGVYEGLLLRKAGGRTDGRNS